MSHLIFKMLLILFSVTVLNSNIELIIPIKSENIIGKIVLSNCDNETFIELELEKLDSIKIVSWSLQSGDCELPSASFQLLPNIITDSIGIARAEGFIRYRNTDPISFEDITDGNHLIIINFEDNRFCTKIRVQ